MTGTSPWACWLAAGLSTGALVGILWLSHRRTARVVAALARWARETAAGNLAQAVPFEPSGQLAELSRALSGVAGRLQQAAEAQRQVEAEHMAELRQQDRALETMLRAGQVSASATERKALLDGAARELATLWPRYYVVLYLLEDDGTSAVLRAEAGTPSAGLLPVRQRVAVSDGTTVGQCLATSEVRTWPETGQRASRSERVFQPGARSELAVPLQCRGNLLGAISMYSDRLETFGSDFLATFQTIGSQLACALEGLRLAEALEDQAARAGYGTSTEDAWRELLRTRSSWGYRYAGGRVDSVEGEWPAEMGEALNTGQTVPTGATGEAGADAVRGPALAMPLKVRDQVIGVLAFRKPEPGAVWTPREMRVLELVVAELSDALVAAQLYEEAQSDAVRRQIIGELSSQMRQSLNVEAVLRTTAAEVRQALGLSEVVVRLRTPMLAEGDASPDAVGKAGA